MERGKEEKKKEQREEKKEEREKSERKNFRFSSQTPALATINL